MGRKKTQNTAKVVSMIMLITLLGKVLGLVRDMMLGHHFGTGMSSAAFLTASRIPRNFFDAIFASAISASFIPVFNEYMEKKDREEAFRLSNAFITVTVLAAALLCFVGMVFSQPLTALLADGFDEETASLCASLLRVLFPTILFTGVAFSLVGILQSLGEFHVPAALSVVSNAVIILYYIFFCDRYGISGLAVAFLIGWAMQALVQLPALHALGYRYRPTLRHEGLKKIFALMLPVMASTWVQPLNLTVATKYASHLNNGAAAAALEYANTLYTIVAGVFVLSIANVIFPELSRMSARRESTALDESLRKTLSAMLLFLVPMSIGLASMARPIVRLLYEWKEWTASSTELTASALMFISLGMLGYGIQNILSRAYYAAQQGKMPLISGLASVVSNLGLCALLAPRMGISGLAIASAVSAVVPALVLLAALRRSHKGIVDRRLMSDVGKMLLAAGGMLAVVLAVRYGCDRLLGDSAAARILKVAVPTLTGATVYLGIGLALRITPLLAPAEKLKARIGAHPFRSSMMIGSLLALGSAVRELYEKSIFCRAWRSASRACAAALEGSVIVAFFRADYDKRAYPLTRCAVRGIQRVQCAARGQSALAQRIQSSVVLDALGERCVFLALCAIGAALPFVPTLVLLLGTLAVFALYLLNVLLGKLPVREMGLCGIFCALFAVCYTVSAVTGCAFPASIEPLLMFLGLMCIVPVATGMLQDERRRNTFLTVLICSACVVSLHGRYQYIVGVPMDPAWVDSENYAELTSRAYSTFGNPNVMGEYLIILCSLSVGMLWQERGRLRKCFYLCTTLLLALGLFVTGSRGSLMGLAVSALVFALFAEHRLLPFGVVAAAAVPFVLPKSIWARFLGALSGADSSTRYRKSIYGTCFDMLRDYWATGIGVGAFAEVYPRYAYSAANAYHSHNLFLQILIELGVVGAAVFLILLLVWAQRLYRAIACDKTRGRFLPGVVLSGMAGLLAQGLTDHLWFNYRIVLLFWLVIGLGCSFKREAQE